MTENIEHEPIPGETDEPETEELKNDEIEEQENNLESSQENAQEQENSQEQKEFDKKIEHNILKQEIDERVNDLGSNVIVEFFKIGRIDDEIAKVIQDSLSKQDQDIDVKKVFAEMKNFNLDTIESENPAHKEALQNIIYEMIIDNPNLGGENINLLAEKWIIKKPEKENQTGYDEIAFFDREKRQIVINPELFEGNYNLKHTILHEFGHAVTLEPHLIYDKESIEDINLIEQMVKNPEKYIGTQGQWIDGLLKDKNTKPEMLIEEITAERTAEYLASGGDETKMLYNHLARFSTESLENLRNKVGKENLENFKKACYEKDMLKIEEFNKNFPEFKQIIDENKIFYDRFNKKLGNRKPEDIKTIIEKNNQNRSKEYYDDFWGDIFGDEFEGGMFSGGISEPSGMGGEGASKGLLDSIKEIFEPLKQAMR